MKAFLLLCIFFFCCSESPEERRTKPLSEFPYELEVYCIDGYEYFLIKRSADVFPRFHEGYPKRCSKYTLKK